MTAQQWTLALVVASFALYIGIAIRSRASTTKEFYVAGTGVSPPANGLATAADWLSAAALRRVACRDSFMGCACPV